MTTTDEKLEALRRRMVRAALNTLIEDRETGEDADTDALEDFAEREGLNAVFDAALREAVALGRAEERELYALDEEEG